MDDASALRMTDTEVPSHRLYFAYGPDMAASFMARMCPKAEFFVDVGIPGYRLTLRTRSREGGSVPSISLEKATGFTVRGVCYRVPAEELEAFRIATLAGGEAEGEWIECLGAAVSNEKDPRSPMLARRYWAADSSSEEDAERLLDEVWEAADERKLPLPYLDFLEGLEFGSEGSRGAVAVLPTLDRSDVRDGLPIVRVARSVGIRHRALCAVGRGGPFCIAVAMLTSAKADGVCYLDQEARVALGFEGNEFYGDSIVVRPLRRTAWRGWRLWRPRTLTLPVCQSSRRDAGKRICVIHPERLRVLGVQEGAWVVLRAAVASGDGATIRERRIRLRAMAWTPRPEDLDQNGRAEAYPSLDHVYLDREARLMLFGDGDARDGLYQPVTIHADVGALIWERLMYYGLGVFAAVLALASVIMPIADDRGWRKGVVGAAIFAGAIVLAFAGVVNDIRHRIRY